MPLSRTYRNDNNDQLRDKKQYWLKPASFFTMLPVMLKKIYQLPNESDRYAAMEGLRAYAVFVVLLVHALGSWSRNINGVDFNQVNAQSFDQFGELINYILWRSHYGVDLFFMLSGFLIFRIVVRHNFNYWHFMKNRVLRIYPAFLLSLLVYIAVVSVYLGWIPLTWELVLKNLLFFNGIPGNHTPAYNHVSWSLFYEFSFYLVFPIILFLLRGPEKLKLILLIAFALIVFSFLRNNFMRYTMFLVGALLAAYKDEELKKAATSIPDIVVLGVYLCSTVAFSYIHKFTQFIPFFAITSAFLFVNTVYGQGFLNKVFSIKPFRYLGNISYSFYLMHPLAIMIVMQFLVRPNQWSASIINQVLFLLTTLVLSWLLATGLFLIAEKPYFLLKAKHFGKKPAA